MQRWRVAANARALASDLSHASRSLFPPPSSRAHSFRFSHVLERHCGDLWQSSPSGSLIGQVFWKELREKLNIAATVSFSVEGKPVHVCSIG